MEVEMVIIKEIASVEIRDEEGSIQSTRNKIMELFDDDYVVRKNGGRNIMVYEQVQEEKIKGKKKK